MTDVHTHERPTPQNVARIEAEKRDGARMFRVGQPVFVRVLEGIDPIPGKVLAVETGGYYGNVVRVELSTGHTKRVVASRVLRRK
jgi:hypothetical protein